MCGEETALLNALEGKRANPRAKPPSPPSRGLWGKPTVVNNVETLCNVPHIVNRGAEWFKSLSQHRRRRHQALRRERQGEAARALGTADGHDRARDPGGHAGGMREGCRFRGLLPGGASTDFLAEEHLDVPMDFAQHGEAGSRLGTGTMIVLDDQTCPVGMVLQPRDASSPGSPAAGARPAARACPGSMRTLEAIEAGEGRPEDMEMLDAHVETRSAPDTPSARWRPGAMEPLRQRAEATSARTSSGTSTKKRCPWRSRAW